MSMVKLFLNGKAKMKINDLIPTFTAEQIQQILNLSYPNTIIEYSRYSKSLNGKHLFTVLADDYPSKFTIYVC